MKNNSSKKSTGSSSPSPKVSKYDQLISWLKDWWLIPLLVIVLVTAGISKYIYPNQTIYSIMIDLTKAIGILMVVMYVIYTRLLRIETHKMAESSMNLYRYEKGNVDAKLFRTECEFSVLPEDAKKVTKKIHIDDKKLSEIEFDKLIKEKNIVAIFLKIKNICNRRIDASKIEYTVRHTGSDRPYDVTCDISAIGTIDPWADKEIGLIVAPEGEIEVSIFSIDYLDGGIVQRVISNEIMKIERIRKPTGEDNK